MSEREDEPTKGEIVRRLDAIAAQQAQILLELRNDRADFAKTYVRQDVYLSQRDMMNAIIADTRADVAVVDGKVEADRTARRSTILWLAGLTITTMIGIAGLIVSVVAR